MEAWHIPCGEKEIGTMLLFDEFIKNGDRHLGNFGFLRSTETGKFLGMAPLFDHGACLNGLLCPGENAPRCPFVDTFKAQRVYAEKGSLLLDYLSGLDMEDIVKEAGVEEKDEKRVLLSLQRNLRNLEKSNSSSCSDKEAYG